MLVTTSYAPTEFMNAKAKALAQELGGRWVDRRRESLARLQQRYQDYDILIVTGQDIRYVRGQSPPLFFHPSVSLVRIKRLLKGEKDSMLSACGVEAGDVVLDCTAGLASDAIVFSYQVGVNGRVIALESERIPALLTREGLRSYESDLEPLNEAMRRVELLHANHLDYLRNQPNRSVDIVYFDPMFRQPVEDSAWISPLRSLANVRPLSAGAVLEACRVASKKVVLKELHGSGEFERLGFEIVSSTNTKVAYGVITC